MIILILILRLILIYFFISIFNAKTNFNFKCKSIWDNYKYETDCVYSGDLTESNIHYKWMDM
jgi:hypothetical protein